MVVTRLAPLSGLFAGRMAELFPESTLVRVRDAKTFVALDNPQAVIDAIATVGGVSPSSSSG
jgi:hypothetical protein